jgi:hypothetical protein
LWKEAAIVPGFKRGNHAAVNNYRPTSIFNNLSKLFQFVIHNYVLYYIKLNPNQHGFTKSKSPVINLVTFLHFMTSVVRDQRQVDIVYFDLSNAFDLIPHNQLLHKLCSFEFADGYLAAFAVN